MTVLPKSVMPEASVVITPECLAAADAAMQLHDQFTTAIDQRCLSVQHMDSAVDLRFGTAATFDLGSDDPTPLRLALIDSLAETPNDDRVRVVVAAHTDNLPISTARFRDNRD